MIKTKLVRMKNGDDIIAMINQDDTNTVMTNPMRLILKRLPTGQVIMMLSPWLPSEVLNEDHASIGNDNVLTIIEPKIQLVEYYNRTVIAFDKLKREFESKIEEHLMEDNDEEDYDDESIENLTEEELREVMQEVSNLKKSNKFFH